MRYGIRAVCAATGVTSRTLRHYDAIGLLPAARDTGNGYRSYTSADMVRLQRILLLRGLGLGLEQIGAILDGSTDDLAALRDHLAFLRDERHRIDRQMASVERTMDAMEKEQEMAAEDMFEGFDHSRYRQEVERRWGAQAYADSDRWWRGLDDAGRHDFLEEAADLSRGWQALHAAGTPVSDADVQEFAARHVRWIREGWAGRQPSPQAIEGLATMYVEDERFAATYGGVGTAAYVRDALVAFARSQ